MGYRTFQKVRISRPDGEELLPSSAQLVERYNALLSAAEVIAAQLENLDDGVLNAAEALKAPLASLTEELAVKLKAIESADPFELMRQQGLDSDYCFGEDFSGGYGTFYNVVESVQAISLKFPDFQFSLVVEGEGGDKSQCLIKAGAIVS